MSDIVLSASVRQNLLSLQSTADLLSTTQNRLATGNKVNSALDNPTNFFTAQGLNNRASDINNLLDSIGNGVQVLQAANTGITSLQKLVDTAKSIANQALQATSGYSTKSQATTAAITGATADNLLGPGGAPTDNTVSGTAANNKNAAAITGATLLSGAAATDSIITNFVAGDTITVNGQNITFMASGASGNNQINVTDSVNTLLGKIDALSGGSGSAVAGGAITLHTGTASDLTVTSSNSAAFNSMGFTGGAVSQTRTPGAPAALEGKTLTIGATDGGTATSVTFGAGGVQTLDQLNTALAANNLTASINSAGALTFTTTNDHAHATIGAFGGTAVAAGAGLFGASVTVSAPVEDANAQNTRATLISQYNAVIDQIKTTAQDSSFNGVNLLNGDQLKLVFNETGKSTLTIQGVTFDPAGLGLASLTKGTDFLDNASTNKVLNSLNDASSSLRSQASTFGSNLSIVQIRQDFSKNLINVLQTGSSNLTLADTNEEA
ncbi:MAG: flagellar protein, partial [Nitrobacter sp. 62-13]|uniref:flagellin N-terminal helical domain-containing protein n=1 Tax=Nitrobacter sp. 62-13 TaxID=1895797 RepID=UPI00095A35A5